MRKGLPMKSVRLLAVVAVLVEDADLRGLLGGGGQSGDPADVHRHIEVEDAGVELTRLDGLSVEHIRNNSAYGHHV